MDRLEIAKALQETGLLLQAKGENKFKARAYLVGARAIASTDESIDELIKEERLTELPGIGASLAKYITDLYETGEAKLLSSLREELPKGTTELCQIPGLTLKRITKLSEELGIESVEQLEDACREGKVAKLKGFGIKLQNDILQAITTGGDKLERVRLLKAFEIVQELLDHLKVCGITDAIEVAGEVRRWHETVDRIVFVTEGSIDSISKCLKEFRSTVSVVETEDSVIAVQISGITIEVFCVENIAIGLVARTGSDEHFAQLKERAASEQLELSANSLRRNGEVLPVKDEREVFKTLNISFIPPEIREGTDEVERAVHEDFSDLIRIDDIRGMTHCHSTFSDGVHSIEEMALAAQKMGMEYITITDHSPTAHYANGLSVERLYEQWDEIDRVQEKVRIKLLKGTECDILADGQLDYPDHILEKFDIVIASIHARYRQDEEAMTKRLLNALRNPHFKIWGHPLGRILLSRDPVPCNVPKLLEAVADARVAIEINGDPHRMDMAPEWASIARQLGLRFVISTDAHSKGNLQNLEFGIQLARRARITKSQVLNSQPVSDFKNSVYVA